MARNASSLTDGLNFASFNTNVEEKIVEKREEKKVEKKEEKSSTPEVDTIEKEEKVVGPLKFKDKVESTPPVKSVESIQPVQQVQVKSTRKIGITLTEENYWYLKDVAYYNGMQMQDYLNQLISADCSANEEVIPYLPHIKQFR